MWERVGILRDAGTLARAQGELDALDADLDRTGLGTAERAFNLTWHDWLNLKNLVAVSRAITRAAAARQESRRAHYRADFPDTGALEASAYSSIRAAGTVTRNPVVFLRVRPGQSLLRDAACLGDRSASRARRRRRARGRLCAWRGAQAPHRALAGGRQHEGRAAPRRGGGHRP